MDGDYDSGNLLTVIFIVYFSRRIDNVGDNEGQLIIDLYKTNNFLISDLTERTK